MYFPQICYQCLLLFWFLFVFCDHVLLIHFSLFIFCLFLSLFCHFMSLYTFFLIVYFEIYLFLPLSTFLNHFLVYSIVCFSIPVFAFYLVCGFQQQDFFARVNFAKTRLISLSNCVINLKWLFCCCTSFLWTLTNAVVYKVITNRKRLNVA